MRCCCGQSAGSNQDGASAEVLEEAKRALQGSSQMWLTSDRRRDDDNTKHRHSPKRTKIIHDCVSIRGNRRGMLGNWLLYCSVSHGKVNRCRAPPSCRLSPVGLERKEQDTFHPMAMASNFCLIGSGPKYAQRHHETIGHSLSAITLIQLGKYIKNALLPLCLHVCMETLIFQIQFPDSISTLNSPVIPCKI